jgi:hypothetical protein
MTPGWTLLDQNKFVNGFVEWQTAQGNLETRSILQITATDTLLLSGFHTGLEVGDSITAVLGCQRNLDDCENLHNNVNNYGGQAWLPVDNPLSPSNNKYY